VTECGISSGLDEELKLIELLSGGGRTLLDALRNIFPTTEALKSRRRQIVRSLYSPNNEKPEISCWTEFDPLSKHEAGEDDLHVATQPLSTGVFMLKPFYNSQRYQKWSTPMRIQMIHLAWGAAVLVLLGIGIQRLHSETKITDYCKRRIVRDDALDNPSRHAWNLFVNLMHPAKDIKLARGEPDCSKPIGAPGTTSVWETWRLARTEVFLEDGSEPPAWEDTRLKTAEFGSTPIEERSVAHQVVPQAQILFDPEKNQSVFVNRGGIGETHMNKATYEFIKANCLYSSDGLKRYAKAYLEGQKPELRFPVESIEVKAVWLEFSEDAVKSGTHKKYYNIVSGGKTYGLTSFHVLTKDVPNWFWATFHHVNAPKNQFEKIDTYGRPNELDGTVWANYVLGGTQTDFTNSIGSASILSDHYIEFGFQRSSCITCHAMAHGTPDGVNGQDFDDPNGAIQTLDVGLPNEKKFSRDGKRFYMQTDFLWSIPFRARAEKQPPAKQCN
jgi:hypothetical protein